MDPSSPKFLSDRSLGKLARWLRIIGYDSKYYCGEVDRGFLNRAWSENRIALTRKREMVRRNFRGKMIVIESDNLPEQIKEVAEKTPIGLDAENLFTLCLRCNERLVGVKRESIKGKVPDYTYETQTEFQCCPVCKKIYWPATHREHAIDFLRIIRGKS